ncbi:MAG: hypothetical protein NC099_03650 [Corallococcus sp.]|nr:hypothetical protein [Bacillota bacterium]MCM1533728.1 hypothetical protein [Corallococcus sp.]
MNKPLIKNIMFYVGVAAIFAAGMLYVLLADWMLTTQSLWLMLAILLSVGSAVCAVLSERFKEKPKALYALKGVAIGLAVCLVAFFAIYLSIALAPAREISSDASSIVKSFAIKSVAGSKRNTVYTLIVFIIVIVFAVISLAAQIADLVLTATIKEE